MFHTVTSEIKRMVIVTVLMSNLISHKILGGILDTRFSGFSEVLPITSKNEFFFLKLEIS